MKALVSIVVPAKDEEETIAKVLRDIDKSIKQIKDYSFEVIVVNDHSRDRTAEIAKSFGVKVVNNRLSAGKGYALKAGFKHAKGEYIIMLDADYSHRPEEIPLYLAKVESGYDFVIGSRSTGGSEEYTKIRTLGNVGLTGLFVLLFGVTLSDALNGYKIFRGDLVRKFKYLSSTYEIEIELLANALRLGYKVGEIPSHERERAGGKMKSSAIIHGPKFLFRILKEGIRYRLYRFSN